jgi:hypothetical protein
LTVELGGTRLLIGELGAATGSLDITTSLSPSLFGVDAAFGVKNDNKVRCFGPDAGVAAGFFVLGRAGVFFSTMLGGWASRGNEVVVASLGESSVVVARESY